MPGSVPQACVLGVPTHCVTAGEALALIADTLQRATAPPLHVVTLNPEMIMQAERDPELAEILHSAGLSIPDGAGVVWALRRQGLRVKRLPGIELAEALLEKAAACGWPVALIGAKPNVLAAACQALSARYAGLTVAYAHHGFFESPEAEAACARACAETGARLVLVALGAPRQEKWIRRYRALFAPGVALLGVGGSLDVWSGLKRRAPAWLRRLNLEWAYRIASEPWRLQRTYKTLPCFALKVLCYRDARPGPRGGLPPSAGCR